MKNIEEGVRNHIKQLGRDKKVKEIQEIVRNTYGLELAYSTVRSIINPHSPGLSSAAGPVKRKYRSRGAAPAKDRGQSTTIEEIKGLVDELHAAYAESLLEIRNQLMKAIAKVRGTSKEE